jgi:aspartate-semialdehyde dehydrogenase
MNSPNYKAGNVSQSQTGRTPYRVAIVGATSLKGKEVAEVLGDRNFPAVDIKLLDDDESLGQLETVGDEITFIQKVRAEQFSNIDFTFFASDPDCTRKNWTIARDAGSAIVDLSYALEEEQGATLRAPWIERQLGHPLSHELQPGPAVIAHPASVVLALLVLRAQNAGSIRRAVCTVLEPASEHGQKGMDELHEQTVNLLSFQPLPKKVFDTQVAFNVVGRYGDQSLPALATLQERIQKHYRRIAGPNAIMPAISLLQAPIFHAYGLALHLEMSEPADIDKLSQALTGEHITLSHAAEDAPSNVNAAGQSEILVSITPDASDANGVWLWATADNLRVAAVTAVESAETMAASRPRGQIQ